MIAWWRHQMETFPALLAICAGNSPVPGEFPAQRPVTRSFDGFFDLRLNKRLSKQSWGWWFETLSRPLWRLRNGHTLYSGQYTTSENCRENYITKTKKLLHIECCGHQIGLIYSIQYFQLVFLWNAFGRPTGVFHGRFTWYLNGILEFCSCLVMT